MSDVAGDVAAAPARVWGRVKWTRASQVTRLMDDDGILGGIASLSPPDAFDALRKSDPAGALRFVAQCLGRVDAVRWMVASLARAEPEPPPARAVAAKAVRRWLATPSDEARRLAYDAGEIAGWQTMEGLACLAVFLSGGSMAPASQEISVNPIPGVFGKVAAGAVLAAALAGGAGFNERLAVMLDHADTIASGGEAA